MINKFKNFDSKINDGSVSCAKDDINSLVDAIKEDLEGYNESKYIKNFNNFYG